MEPPSVPGTPPPHTMQAPFFIQKNTIIPESPPKHPYQPVRAHLEQNLRQSLSPSPEAAAFMGIRVPTNTKRQNQSSLRAFARFVTGVPGFGDDFFHTEPHMRSLVFSEQGRLVEWQMEQTRCNVFPDEEGRTFLPPGFSSWTSAQLERIRYFLIEFVVNYRSAKRNSEVKPSSMKSYLLGIQRGFSAIWGYKLKMLEGPVFNSPQEVLTAVIDNNFRLQQASGVFTESHNVLSKDDLLLLYGSPLLSRDTLKSFQARLVFDVALITAMRPTALVNLTVSQFRNITLRGENV